MGNFLWKKYAAEDNGKEKDEPVNFLNLFKYSSRLDRIFISLGCTAAISSGVIFLVMIIMLGDVIDVFVERIITQDATVSTETAYNTTQDADALLRDTFHFITYYSTLVAIYFGLCLGMVSFFSVSAANQAFRIKCLFMKAVLRQDMGWFDTNETGDFAAQITGNLGRIQDGIGISVGICILLLTQTLLSIASSLYHGWKLTLVMMGVMLVTSFLIRIFSKLQAKAAAREKDSYSLAGAVAEEVLSSIKTVVAFEGEKQEIDRYDTHVSKTKSRGIKRSLITSITASWLSSSFFLLCALTFWYGVTLIVEGRTSGIQEYKVKNLIIVCFNMMGAAQTIVHVAPHLEAFNIARGAATKLFKIIERIPKIDSSSMKGKKPDSFSGDITLNNVCFSYPARPEAMILRDFTLKIKSGEMVALVGASGCGKSTIIQLLQRFYDVDDGHVEIDQTNIKDLNIGWLRNNIGVVDQEPILFSTTIAENIRHGNSNVTEVEIEEAAKIANAHAFIVNLPERYNTVVGSNGAQLSGGQKQRIAIARAIVKNPKILLLDEATSALDREGEILVQTALDEVRQNKTTIIITHHLSTIQAADKIAMMHDGRIKEIGTHDELMIKRGLYYQLFIKQNCRDSVFSESTSTSILSSRALQVPEDLIYVTSDSSTQPLLLPANDRNYLKNVIAENIKPSLIRVLQFSSPELPYITVGGICALVSGACPLCYGIIFGDILQLLSQDNSTILSDIIHYSVLFVGLAIASGTAAFMQTFMFSIAGEELTKRLRNKAFSTMIYQEMSWFDLPENGIGALCSRLSSDTSDVQAAGGIRISTILQAFSTLIFTMVIGFYYKWQLGFIVLPSIPLIMVATYMESILIYKHTLSYKSAVDDASKVAIEAIINIRTVASLHQEKLFYLKFKNALIPSLKRSRINSIVRGIVYGISQVIPVFQAATTLYFGSIYVANNDMPYGDVLKVCEAIVCGSGMIAQVIVFSPDYQKAKIAAARLFKLLDIKPKTNRICNEGNALDNWTGDVEFKNVYFNYPSRPSVEILKDVNLAIEPGKTVALVGKSGCGKSTCIQLIERFYKTSHGILKVDSKKIDSVKVSSLRKQLGLVSQEPVLFSESITKNIAHGKDNQNINVQEIITAARNANAHEFITALPQGYSTVLGQKGTQLSGGQKQRIALARALFRKPKLLLLDEATSSLDAENEQVVQEALDNASDGRTCLMITHRLATIQNADMIAVIEDGSIVEKGTHQELLELQGHYHRMHNSQDRK